MAFLNVLSSLDYPDDGYLEIDSKKVNYFENKSISKLRNEQIGFIFQLPYLLPEFTALENVLMPSWIKNKENILNEALDILGLEISELNDMIDKSIIDVPLSPKSEAAQVIFANSITLTPGTITVESEKNSLLVHSLNFSDTTEYEIADMG